MFIFLNLFAPKLLSVRKEEWIASKICCPTQRNATFILVCTVFDYDDTNRKQKTELVFSFEQKWHKESQEYFHQDYF